MREYIQDLMEKIEFEREAQKYFLKFYDSLGEDDIQTLKKLKKRLFIGNVWGASAGRMLPALTPALEEFAKKNGMHRYSADMLFLLYCARRLQENYALTGLSEAIFYETMRDLTYKLEECKKMYGVYGTFVYSWFFRHYTMQLFQLGCFQYEKIPFRFEDYRYKDSTMIKRGEQVYNIHIPSGVHLTEQARMDSYKKLYEFVKTPETTYIPITCSSWLLYPSNRQVYPEHSNLMGFLNDFDIISSEESEEVFPDAWRVFYKEFDGDTSQLPRETTLQRRYIDWLDAGNKVGGGTGVFLFDGEKILNKDKREL